MFNKIWLLIKNSMSLLLIVGSDENINYANNLTELTIYKDVS